jgi:hypothetical protein
MPSLTAPQDRLPTIEARRDSSIQLPSGSRIMDIRATSPSVIGGKPFAHAHPGKQQFRIGDFFLDWQLALLEHELGSLEA